MYRNAAYREEAMSLLGISLETRNTLREKAIYSMPKQPSDLGAMWTCGGVGVTLCMFRLQFHTHYHATLVPSD